MLNVTKDRSPIDPLQSPYLVGLLQGYLKEAKALMEVKSEFGRLPSSNLKERALQMIDEFFENGVIGDHTDEPPKEVDRVILADAFVLLWKHNALLRPLMQLNIDDSIVEFRKALGVTQPDMALKTFNNVDDDEDDPAF